ncbi:MAG: serine/threonine-protein kinase [Kofleriaceae bacterium]
MAKPALIAAGIVLLAAGAGVAGYGATRKAIGGRTPEASAMMTSAIGQLDGDIRAAQSDVTGNAEALVGLQQVQAAVATDVATVRNMVERGELAFTVKPGTVVEIGQVMTGQGASPLYTQPDNAMRSSHAGKPGSYVELLGDKALVTQVSNVVPKDRANELTGYVMVSRPLDLGPAFAKLEQAHIEGTFALDGKTRQLGAAPAAGTRTETLPLPSVPGANITVAVPLATGGPRLPLVAGGGAAGGLGLILLIVGVVTGKRRDARASSVPEALPQPSVGTARTEMSAGSTAVGTPSPIGSTIGSAVGAGGAGEASLSSANLGPGTMIGRWEIIHRLGSGGMADVYLARARGEAGFEKQVAVKVMHPHLARNDRAVEHFLDEARLSSRISHPNVVQILDLGKIGNDYVIVMEYVDGLDLEKLLASARVAQRQVPIEIGLGMLCRICDGLDAAHTSTTVDGAPTNLVHRDVKCANVLVSKQGGVKVVDFGIAKAASQAHLTAAGETKGTPSMMAPEQRVGDQVDVRADVYSVGAVAFEILTGQGVNLDLAALAYLGVENWPHLPMPSTLRPQLPRELDALLMQCMSYERDKRPADCAVLGAQFEAVMKQHGLTASDKDIARWVAAEATAIVPSPREASAPHAAR